jgi:Tfp pilus assembly protein PilX
MVLLLCLIFLLALTLVGLSASSDTILQHRLASNLQETERAKQSALLTLSWAEQWILSLDGAPPEPCIVPCDGLYLHQAGGLPAQPESENLSWWLTQGHEAGINPINGVRLATLSSDSVDLPVWIIEQVKITPAMAEGNPDLQTWYRILARGSGRKQSSVSVLESTIVRSWPTDESNETADPGAPLSCTRLGVPANCGRYAWRELR